MCQLYSCDISLPTWWFWIFGHKHRSVYRWILTASFTFLCTACINDIFTLDMSYVMCALVWFNRWRCFQMTFHQVLPAIIAVVFRIVVMLTKHMDELCFWLSISTVSLPVVRTCCILFLIVFPSVIWVNFCTAWMNHNNLRVPWVVFVPVVNGAPTWKATMVSSWPMRGPITNLNIIFDFNCRTNSDPSIQSIIMFSPNTLVSEWMSLELAFNITVQSNSSCSDISNLRCWAKGTSFIFCKVERLSPTIWSWLIDGILS